ncbi:helix-turn-helix domain-containing protein [Rhodococcus sp. NPDC059968]|uniref:helix-turn-helix domain-containing protein n=1 Tax=Rhodococcus sp. NPDC059968 TaxID=3347017 RepID=UPI00366EF6EA
MDNQIEVREFLRTRRGRIGPTQAGLATGTGHRRVPGLRREEVALLAGISIDYYARMERGNLAGVSDDVLDSLSRALQLDEAETRHLYALTRAAQPQPIRRRKRSDDQAVRPTLQRFLDAVTGTPAWVRNQRMDFIAANPLGHALLAPLLTDPANRGNNARFVFLDPAAHTYYPAWERGADDIVADLRTYAGRNPLDKGLTEAGTGSLIYGFYRIDQELFARHTTRWRPVATVRYTGQPTLRCCTHLREHRQSCVPCLAGRPRAVDGVGPARDRGSRHRYPGRRHARFCSSR